MSERLGEKKPHHSGLENYYWPLKKKYLKGGENVTGKMSRPQHNRHSFKEQQLNTGTSRLDCSGNIQTITKQADPHPTELLSFTVYLMALSCTKPRLSKQYLLDLHLFISTGSATTMALLKQPLFWQVTLTCQIAAGNSAQQRGASLEGV